jgi:hypothetical protein
MGMDLYKYKLTAFSKEELDNMTETDLEDNSRSVGGYRLNLTKDIIQTEKTVEDEWYVHDCISKTLKKYDIPNFNSTHKYGWDFEDNCKPNFVAIFKDDIINSIESIQSEIDKLYQVEEFIDRNKISYLEDKIHSLKDRAFKDKNNYKYVEEFGDIKTYTEYSVCADFDEIGYDRKPFRSIGENDKDDTKIELYRKIMREHSKGKYNHSFVVFDRDNEKYFKQIIDLIDDEDYSKENLTNMLPFEENEIIMIDW